MTRLTDAPTDQAPADPGATDEMLATQPIGYWSGLAHAAVTRHLRDAMARIDLATEVRTVVHEGISEEEYVAALKVLRRMVANTGEGPAPQ